MKRKHNTAPNAAEPSQKTSLESEFLSASGVTSLDLFAPVAEDTLVTAPTVISRPAIAAVPLVYRVQPKSFIDARQRNPPTAAPDMLTPFIGTHITYASRKRLSSYSPSSLMMDYIVHQINFNLVDNFYFKRAAPDYHPYIIRLYYAVLFWIQCLRAGHDVATLSKGNHQFLVRFLDAHPPESLPIAGPLLPLFKTLCCSQPEISTFGEVYPRLPDHAGPVLRSDFIRDDPAAFMLPNVPGIFALIEHLKALFESEQTSAAAKRAHIPVTDSATEATVFGHHTFPAPAARSPLEKWALCSSGLQYACEAEPKLNESFIERFSNYDFPPTEAGDFLTAVDCFLSMSGSLAWFSQVKNVAATTAAHFQGSGTLADCNTTGINANQLQVLLQDPEPATPAPTCSADRASLFPFAFKLKTSARSPPALAEAMAAMAQTNIRMPSNHPYLSNYGATTLQGEFWDIRPEEYSPTDDSSYLSISDIVKKLMISK